MKKGDDVYLIEKDMPVTKLRVSGYDHDYQPNPNFHQHEHYEILIIKKGSGRNVIDFKSIDIEANQVFFIRPGQYHQFIPDSGTQFYFIALDHDSIQFSTSVQLKKFEFFQHLYFEGYLVFEDVSVFIELICLIQVELKSSDRVNQKMVIANYTVILLTKLQQQFLKMVTDRDFQLSLKSPLVFSFFQLIDDDICTYRFVKEYAANLFVSANYLNGLVHDHTEQPASYWINKKIVLLARRLLVNEQLSFKEIALKLNYSNVSHFSRFFKQQFGCSPRLYRQSKDTV